VAQVSWTSAAPGGLTLARLTPATATAGGPAFSLTADGSNFVSGATLLWNGAARTTSFVGSTRVTASISAADIAAAASIPVTVQNPDGVVSNAQTFTVTSSVAACPTGQFFAEYFNNVALSGSPVQTACESFIYYNWGSGGPAGLPVDNFSVRWTGQFQFSGGNTTFTVAADDGVRLYVDGTLLIDAWIDEGATTYTATRTLTAGQHEVKVEYYERTGDAVIQVLW
jgi:PA14 domain